MTDTNRSAETSLEDLRDTVRERYGAVARRVAEGSGPATCCEPGSSGCCGTTSETWDPITADLYEAGQTAGLYRARAQKTSFATGHATVRATRALRTPSFTG